MGVKAPDLYSIVRQVMTFRILDIVNYPDWITNTIKLTVVQVHLLIKC